MNNYQWLLQMDGADRKAWFDAEHVETKERALDGDTDALERKSADLIHEYYKPMVAELQAKVDRLTAERDEWKSCWEKCKAQSDAILAERDNLKANNEQLHTLAGEQAAQIDELQKQVDELEAKCEHQRRELAMFNNLVNTHGLAITDDCWDYRSVRELCDENDELQTRLFRVEADCERYRSKFGKCIDYADAIHALMDDEGMA